MTQYAFSFSPARRPGPARVISYGAGLDSWVMLLLAVALGIPIDAVVFADVGDPDGEDPGEWPQTYEHLRTVVIPFCKRHGIPFITLDGKAWPVRDARSLYRWFWERKQIPVSGPDRLCTIVAKVERFERWLDATYPGRKVEVWVGFEAGEEDRATKDPNAGRVRRGKALPRGRVHLNLLPKPRPLAVRCNLLPKPARRLNRFILIEQGLCRCRSLAYAQGSGFPVPPGSACMLCCYNSKGDWQQLAQTQPVAFAQGVELEARKPPTEENGLKLSIAGYDSKKMNKMMERGAAFRAAGLEGPVQMYVPRPLDEYVKQGTYRPKLDPCKVCGAPVRVRKNVGCGFEAERAPAPAPGRAHGM